eukprot:CAMPEP_0178708532 /NCGR_PEP_ID=MMETSP0699-20121125/16689_1 /TAXON_ID=265572 /ORGANISM="Extubocellulus spinifer, Strain CCMP396" /LENGTH=50 /DNA_ID=CAMNT_0020356803 /DNA_START=429 /DNA_END=581 /DNA_ORIENTATION=+
MDKSKVALATEYSSSSASSLMWNKRGSSVDMVTLSPRLNSLGNGDVAKVG